MRNMGSLVEPGILQSNKVVTLLNGDQIFPAMLEAVRGARRSICLETYMYWSGDAGRDLLRAAMQQLHMSARAYRRILKQ